MITASKGVSWTGLTTISTAVAICRAHRYPPTTKDMAAKTRGIGAHTDFGALTLLLQDDSESSRSKMDDVMTFRPCPLYTLAYRQLISPKLAASKSFIFHRR